jgi:hypothetical protein
MSATKNRVTILTTLTLGNCLGTLTMPSILSRGPIETCREIINTRFAVSTQLLSMSASNLTVHPLAVKDNPEFLATNHIFGQWYGQFLDVYLDDIIIYSDTIEDHIKHIRMVADILRKEQLYLTTSDKLQFFVKKLTVLGHVIDEKGLVMDPHKVDTIQNWKVPTNRELVLSFLGAVGFLAPDCPKVRIPMGVLTKIASKDSIWRWGPTEQCAFEEIKKIVYDWRDHHRKAIDYSDGADPIHLVCDTSLTGAGGTLSQGKEVKSAQIIAFWSAKFNSAQQNYPVHDRELLAIVELLKRFRYMLLGAKFLIWTDHKPLKYLRTQANLSPRQSRWLETISEFYYEIRYIKGKENVMADTLSRMYSNESKGVVRAKSEYIHEDFEDERLSRVEPEEKTLTSPVYTGVELQAMMVTPSKSGIVKTLVRNEGDEEYAVLPMTQPPKASRKLNHW